MTIVEANHTKQSAHKFLLGAKYIKGCQSMFISYTVFHGEVLQSSGRKTLTRLRSQWVHIKYSSGPKWNFWT